MTEQPAPSWGRHESRVWQAADRADYVPAEHAAAGRYSVFIPPLLAGLSLTLGDGALKDAAEASTHLAELRATEATLPRLHSLRETLLRSESVASSRIEGVQMSHARLARVRHEPRLEDKNARDVLANIEAMRTAIVLGASAETLGTDALVEIHTALIGDTRLDNGRLFAGEIRQEQNWIGGNGFNPIGAAHVPPPFETVPELLEDLGKFIDRDDVPAIAQAAIAHAQFETIHPFLDGNGRVGRALVYSILQRHGELSEYVPPISLVLASSTRGYLWSLNAYREGNVDSIVELFSTATSRACIEAQRLGAEVKELQQQWERRLEGVRAHSSARRLLDVLPGSPVLTAAEASKATGVAVQNVGAALELLTERGILKPLNAKKWGRGWEAPELFDLVEVFERRVGRHTRFVGTPDPEGSTPVAPAQK
jgi:Fic family protein